MSGGQHTKCIALGVFPDGPALTVIGLNETDAVKGTKGQLDRLIRTSLLRMIKLSSASLSHHCM